MGEINAVIGLSQLRCVNDLLSARRKLADQYRARLSGIADIETIPVPPNMAHSYYKFPILLPTVAMRNAVSEALREKHQIETGSVYWPPCHMQPVAKTNPGLYCSRSAMIAAEDVLPRILCLPIHPKLTEESVEHVVRTLAEEIKRL
jgi:dTDP-4-amino-4,6-dideoxy-D-glucose transaminase